MRRIHQLPESVITQIAAGEVIERPASVVKELLENSVDAGARRIDIEVDQGGADLIRVVDDGCGIVTDDLPLAFACHATSKLTDADDLFRVATLGFRGEALASIASVSHVTLQSRQPHCEVGSEISCSGSKLSEMRPWNGSPGTRVEVRHLFYNMPVRRKFLRTPGTEMGHICEVFTRLALAQPGLHLTLRHNGKHVYEVPATANLLDRLGLFFGATLRDKLYPLEADAGPVRLYGFAADPACERGNAKMQYLFLNGRSIRDRSLAHALQEAYRGLLMTGRFAVAFIFLEMPAELVDVNVHPTKVEVRFRDGHGLYSLVLNAVRKRLSAANLTPRLQAPSTLEVPRAAYGTSQVYPTTTAPFDEPHLSGRSAGSNDVPSSMPLHQPAASVPRTNGNLPTTDGHVPAVPQQTSLLAEPTSLKAIQLYNAYLVLETAAGMLVIDQHALHERILFEQLKRRLKSGSLESQQLLIPEPIELTAEQAARLLEQRQPLEELGIGIQDFGGGTVLLTSYPALLGNRAPQAVVKAVVDHLMNKDRVPTREQLFEHLLSLMACHAAVRSGDALTGDEIAALIAQRESADDTHHCPHGRPTSLLFTRHDLDRQFRRV